MVLFKPSKVFEFQHRICLLCHLLARISLIPSQTSSNTCKSELCWMHRTLASRDFPELCCLSWVFLISICKLRKLFSFPLFIQNQSCLFTDVITLQIMSKWKCHLSCFRHLGLKAQLSKILIPKYHEVLSQTSPFFCPPWLWKTGPQPVPG